MDKINPIGLKGNQITERMKELMGIQPIVENKKTSVVELTKLGPDGKVYGIVRENHEYYIKIADNKKNLVIEDFSYIGGLKNKKDFAYSSYAKATKQLNLKFNSLYENYNITGDIDILKNDNLLKEDIAGFDSMNSGFAAEGNMEEHPMSECCGAPMYEGMCSECGMTLDEYNKEVMKRMKDQYGDKKGIGVYYATANAQDRDPENFEKNEDYMPEELIDNEPSLGGKHAGDQADESFTPEIHKVKNLSNGRIIGTYDAINGFKVNKDGALIGYKDSKEIPRGADKMQEEGWGISTDMHKFNMDEELDEIQQAVQNMYEEDKKPIKQIKKGKLSIAKSLNEMDNIIEEFAPSKKKVYSIR